MRAWLFTKESKERSGIRRTWRLLRDITGAMCTGGSAKGNVLSSGLRLGGVVWSLEVLLGGKGGRAVDKQRETLGLNCKQKQIKACMRDD
mmetsp:Transcript_11297/g.21780  ORF Transcript_11297/g.21780 Transcript_11297/m.21780 type:complete len:90 (-) Transcript_11297:126-395(-)